MPVQKKIVKEFTLYTLEEMLADSKLRTNLLEANREDETFIMRSLEQSAEELKDQLISKGFEGVKISWDLSDNQGSGCCFDFDGCNVFKIAKHYPKILDRVNKIRFAFKDWNRGRLRQLDTYSDISTCKNHFATHYCHSKTRDLEYHLDRIEDCTELRYFKHDFYELYQNICHEIEAYMRKELDYYTSDESLIEDLKATQDCSLFYSNGVICNEFDITNIEENKGEAVKIAKTLDKFLSEDGQENFVITDQDGKILSRTDSSKEDIAYLDENGRIIPKGDSLRGDIAFLDTTDEPDLGFQKAILFTQDGANEYIVNHLQQEYDVRPVEKIFKK